MNAKPASPGRTVATPFRLVAIPAGIALGAIGAIAAERLGLPAVVGFAGGMLAAALSVLALPSIPTRRATVLLLGIGGLGALRHAPYPGGNRVWLLGFWAVLHIFGGWVLVSFAYVLREAQTIET